MSDLPDDFTCTITNWEYIYGLCRDVADEVRAAEFDPDVIVALARGGWFAGRCCCDFLGLDDLTSLKMEHPSAVRTATLQLLDTSEFVPEFVGERLDEWAWIVYPWNFIEDMIDLIEGVMERADTDRFDRADVRRLLAAEHDIQRIEMEIAQPDRLNEVLAEMERRSVVEATEDDADAWRLA